MTIGGDLILFRDGDEANASTRGTLASLQKVPKDFTYEDHEQHVSMLMANETKQWRKCVPTLNAISGTHIMIDHSFVIKTLDTKDMLGVHGLTTFEEDTLDYDIL